MSIDRATFTKGMALLMDRFGRQLGTPTVAAYLEILDDELTTEEFAAAAREVFRRDTFFPSPQRFIDAVRGDPRRAAETAWQAIMRDARAGRYPPLESLPPAVRAALKVAPMREIMSADDYQLSRLKRDFLEEHVRASGGQASAQPRLEQQDEDPLRLGS